MVSALFLDKHDIHFLVSSSCNCILFLNLNLSYFMSLSWKQCWSCDVELDVSSNRYDYASNKSKIWGKKFWIVISCHIYHIRNKKNCWQEVVERFSGILVMWFSVEKVCVICVLAKGVILRVCSLYYVLPAKKSKPLRKNPLFTTKLCAYCFGAIKLRVTKV